MKLWQKDAPAEDWVTRFTVGEDWRWDTLLLPFDIEGTRGHARALHRIDLLTRDELAYIERALGEIQDEVTAGRLGVGPEDEDAHTVIERELTNRLGDTGKKIHAGRSRNDQVLVAIRLFLRERLRSIGREIRALSARLCDLAGTYADALMPGYTHLQRAMPTTAGLWAAGFAELLLYDLTVLHAAARAIDRSPWGSAAGYGVPHLRLPRAYFADELGFVAPHRNVTSVQLSRGKFELQVVHALVQAGTTINRMASDLVQFNMAEFGFVRLPEPYCTGSSIMPQKKNPDVLELARASVHRLTAEMHLLTSLPMNLPSGYHRDLQLTKEAVMRATLLAEDVVGAMHHVLIGLSFDRDRMRQALSPDLFATAEALRRVKEGLPFREAYREVARELDTLRVPSPEKALAAYADEGTPGRPDLSHVLEGLDAFATWLGGA